MHATSPFARRQRLAFLPVVVCVLGGTANADEKRAWPRQLARDGDRGQIRPGAQRQSIYRSAHRRNPRRQAASRHGRCDRQPGDLHPPPRQLRRARQSRVIEALEADGLADPEDDKRFSGGLTTGVFPAVRADGTDCPQLTQPFTSAPGSGFGGHHSYPGGLPVPRRSICRAPSASPTIIAGLMGTPGRAACPR